MAKGRVSLEKLDKYASIIAAIIAVLAFSQGNRIVSYAFIIIGYVLMASFLWRVMAQKTVVKRVIRTCRTLPEKRRYRYSRSQRWMAGIALAVLTLFSFGWVGANGWRDYQAWYHAREGLLFPRAEETELLVIIAQFDNRSTKGIDPTQRIYDRLLKELGEAGITNARLEIATGITNLNEAREVGERHEAIFVIWGWFDDVGFSPNFTIVKEKPFLLTGMKLEEVSIEPPKDFSLYIREGLPAQMAYFSTLTIGQVYFWDGEFEKALSAFDRAIECAQQGTTSEGLADVYFYQGYIHGLVLNDLQRTITDFDTAIELRPNYAEAYNNRGVVYDASGEYDLAIADYDKAIELRPDFAVAYFNRGSDYILKSENDLAIADFDKAIELELDYAEAYVYRGLAYRRKGEYDLAIADYDRAIELRPDFDEAYFNRGATYADKGEYDLAIANYGKVIELKPDLAEAYNNRGIAYDAKGEYDLAIADFDKAIELEPDDAKAYGNRGGAYILKGEYDLAIADFNKAIELRPDYAEVYNNRGFAYDVKGEHDLAIADYDRAIKLRPDDAEAYGNRGNAYARKGAYDLAIADYDRAIELKPHLVQAYYNRGLIHETKGEKDEAIRDFERFLELSEDEDSRKKVREHLKELRGQ